VALIKTCPHGRGKPTPNAKLRAWRRCDCAWYARFKVDGRDQLTNLGADLTAARIRHARLRADRAEGRLPIPRGGPRLMAVAERWLAELERAGRKPKTLAEYTVHLGHIRRWWGDVPVGTVTAREIGRWREELGRERSAHTVNLIVGTLRAILRQAQREGLIETLPEAPRQIAPRRRVRPPERLTLPESERVVAALDPPWRLLGELILLTGLRIGEGLALRPEHVDLSGSVLRIEHTRRRASSAGSAKTEHSERTTPLSPRAVEILRERLAQIPAGYLWPGAQDGAARYAIWAAYERAGIPRPSRPWHSLRHAAAALGEAAGFSLREQGAWLGHGPDTTVTLGYGFLA